MDLTLLATGSPVPTVERGGTSQLIEAGGEPILVDCGPRTVLRLLEAGADLADLETLIFTHHHVDHNADLFQFVIASWSAGRRALDVYGPTGTADFIDAMYDLYEEDIAYRQWFGHGGEGIEDIDVTRTTPELTIETDAWSATALPVEHSIETYAYRFEETATGTSCVITGDTRRLDSLAEFATDADVLVCDACIGPPLDAPTPPGVPARFGEPIADEVVERHKQNHCDAADAGDIAAAAGVDTLVLTHLLPHRDAAAMRAQASGVFDGEVLVAEDGLELTV